MSLVKNLKQKAVSCAAAIAIAVAALMIVATPAVAVGGSGSGRANANPGVIPNAGNKYETLGAKWWQWAYSFPADEVPFFNDGGPVDVSAHQSGHVWFLAGGDTGTNPRTGSVPPGTTLFFPIANLINDYPCVQDPSFQPLPGETLEQFLQRTGNAFLPEFTDLFAEIDGVPLRNLTAYRATSPLFIFTADPALAEFFDPCVTGSRQPGVAVGYWLLLTPLTPGVHTLHFGSPSWGQNASYVITVK